MIARCIARGASAHAVRPAAFAQLSSPLMTARVTPSHVQTTLRRAYCVPARQSTYLGDSAGVTAYSSLASWYHWGMAAGIMTVIGTVKISQNSTAEQRKRWGVTKGGLMNLHKSVAVLMAVAIVPRLAIRLTSIPPPLPVGPAIEHAAAHASHLSLYFFMVVMPASGIAMGYYSGKGVPFFGATIFKPRSDDKKDGAKAKKYYGLHKRMGKLLTMLVPLHIGATGVHLLKDQNLFLRFRWS